MKPRWTDQAGASRGQRRPGRGRARQAEDCDSAMRGGWRSVRRYVPHALAAVVLTAAAVLAASACSGPARHRVLTFFFDGVPKPGGDTPGQDTGEPATDTPESPGDERKPAANKAVFYNHQPYWENRCRDCHDPNGGQVYQTAEQGLCATCHPDLPGNARYVHGPVAVKSCLFCHHYHRSLHAKLLLDEPDALCFRCHKREGLTEGEHHADIDERPCIECHDPHSGDDRFFLKRGES